LKNISFVLYGAITVSAILVVGVTSTINNFEVARAQIQSDLDAASVYDSSQMKLGNNVKHLVIVIPNEGHHGPGEADEARFIAQPFIPQNANNTGEFAYADTVEYEEGFVMTGTIRVVDEKGVAASSAATFDTV
jgi:hypothetical protein